MPSHIHSAYAPHPTHVTTVGWGATWVSQEIKKEDGIDSGKVHSLTKRLKLERDFVVQTQLDSGIKSIERLKYDAKGSEWKEDTGQGAREDDVWVSKYRGVNREFAAGKWKAEIWIRKSKQQIGKSKHQHLGNFEEEQDKYLFWSIIIKKRPAGRGRTTAAKSHARQVACGKTPTANPLPPTLSTTQEVGVSNVSRHSAGATRRPKPITTASWRLALPWVSLGAGW
jgi:hypothetical protein